MAKFKTPEEREKHRAQQRHRKIAMYSFMTLFVVVVAFLIVQVVEHFVINKEPIKVGPLQKPNENITKQAESWNNFDGEVQKTINLEDYLPELAMVQVAENGRVPVNYFDDAVFVGDSLADGFKIYAGALNLAETGAVYITKPSLSPKSFLQPGVQIDVGAGPIDPWATIQQRNPKKVYVTLGTNALMAMSPQELIDSYYPFIAKLKENAPGAIIYITTITPVTAFKSAKEPRLSYDRIYESNKLIAKMCREEGLALINLYDVLKSGSGYLREDISYSDGIHLTPEGYGEWFDYLTTHTVYDPTVAYV